MNSRWLQGPLAALLMAGWAFAGSAEKPATRYISPSAIDVKLLLSGPPANDSEQTKTEIREILSLQASRTPAQVARGAAEVTLTSAAFAGVIGTNFDFKTYPITDALLEYVHTDTKAISDMAKKYWNRPRPFVLDPTVIPAVDKPANASFPSGHTTLAYVWANVLAELFPEKKNELLARAEEIGVDRILVGVHYRSDVVAGKKLGETIAAKILKSPAFQSDLAAARTELAGHHEGAQSAGRIR